jgi:hypothetical protein
MMKKRRDAPLTTLIEQLSFVGVGAKTRLRGAAICKNVCTNHCNLCLHMHTLRRISAKFSIGKFSKLYADACIYAAKMQT